jgi:hypothetical protein
MIRPQLAIVVDTEEEFDWTKPFARENRATQSIPAQALAHEIYDPLGMVPTYVIDHPVATDPRAAEFLTGLQRAGRAEIGTHLHPWVSPPHEEDVNRRNSYHCNLPPALERAKIVALTDAITQAVGRRPVIFKAGRYGFGRNTAHVLAELGYEIDCSYVPHVSFADDGGPDYRGTPDQPFWLDAQAALLEVPLTSGFFGVLASAGPAFHAILGHRHAERLRVPGVLARSGLLTRSRLSPEGVSAEEQCRLLHAMVKAGRRFFTLTYHSPSLAAGNTPYVRTEADLADFLKRIETVLLYFRDQLGGEFTTLTRHREAMLAARAAEAA